MSNERKVFFENEFCHKTLNLHIGDHVHVHDDVLIRLYQPQHPRRQSQSCQLFQVE